MSNEYLCKFESGTNSQSDSDSDFNQPCVNNDILSIHGDIFIPYDIFIHWNSYLTSTAGPHIAPISIDSNSKSRIIWKLAHFEVSVCSRKCVACSSTYVYIRESLEKEKARKNPPFRNWWPFCLLLDTLKNVPRLVSSMKQNKLVIYTCILMAKLYMVVCNYSKTSRIIQSVYSHNILKYKCTLYTRTTLHGDLVRNASNVLIYEG